MLLPCITHKGRPILQVPQCPYDFDSSTASTVLSPQRVVKKLNASKLCNQSDQVFADLMSIITRLYVTEAKQRNGMRQKQMQTALSDV